MFSRLFSFMNLAGSTETPRRCRTRRAALLGIDGLEGRDLAASIAPGFEPMPPVQAEVSTQSTTITPTNEQGMGDSQTVVVHDEEMFLG